MPPQGYALSADNLNTGHPWFMNQQIVYSAECTLRSAEILFLRSYYLQTPLTNRCKASCHEGMLNPTL